MATLNRIAPLTPFLHFTHLESLSLSDLDRHSRRAEDCMNRALDERRWSLVCCYRDVMLAVQQECDRRLCHTAEDGDGSRTLGEHR